MRAGDVLPHPLNPKRHPVSQVEPLEGLLRQIGKADVLRAYRSERNGGMLTFWDGHGRRDLNPDEVWQVAIYDIDDDEADMLIASFDEVGFLAQKDTELQRRLLAELEADDQALDALLDSLRLESEQERESGASVGGSGERRLAASKNQTVKAVIVARQVAIIEAALMATEIRNRGEALTAVCREYLIAKGQFDFLKQEEIAAEIA